MKFARTPRFYKDCEKLARSDTGFSELLNTTFPLVARALTGNSELYEKFRIKPMRRFRGILEGHLKNNLCFTFHYETSDNGEKICFFRRIGTHGIYKKP